MNHLVQLKQLKNKPQLYKQEPLTITEYEIDEEGLHLQVNRNGKQTEMLVPIHDAREFFKDLLPLDAISLPGERAALSVYSSQQQSLTTLRNQLMELNTKLSGPEGEKYIKQAKAINNNINTLLNSLKLEMTVARELRKQQ